MSTFKELQDRTLDGSKRAGLTDLVEIKSLVNQAYFEMRARVRPAVTVVNKTLTLNQSVYSIVTDLTITDLVNVRHIVVNDSGTNQTYVLEKATSDFILLLQQTQSTTGGGMRFWAQDGLDLIRLFPAPSSTTLVATITYNARAALMVIDGDVPAGIPVEFHDTIILGALARSLRVWHPPTARQYHADFIQGIMEYRQWMNRQGGSVHAKAVVNPTRSNIPLHDNSMDYSGMN